MTEVKPASDEQVESCKLLSNGVVAMLILRIESDRAALASERKLRQELHAALDGLKGATCALVFIPGAMDKFSAEVFQSIDVAKAALAHAAEHDAEVEK